MDTAEEFKHRWMIQMRAQDALQYRVDLRGQATDAITGLSDLADQIIVEAIQHRQFCDFIIRQLQ